MLTAFIYGLISTLAIYFIIALAYLITIAIFLISKSNKADIAKFSKHLVIVHAIYFLPFTILKMFVSLEHYIIALIFAIILIFTIHPVISLITRTKNKKE